MKCLGNDWEGFVFCVAFAVELPLFQLTTSTSQRPNWYVPSLGSAEEFVDAIMSISNEYFK